MKVRKLVVLVASISSCFAQPKIGVRFGYNLSGFYKFIVLKTNDGRAWKSGINIGVVSDFKLAEKVVFRPGVYYSMKGFKDINFGEKYSYNYLESPLLAVFQQPLGESLKLEIQVGPYFGIGIGGKSENFGLPDYNTFGGKFGKDRFDWGLNIGCGINIKNVYVGVAFEDGCISDRGKCTQHCLMANVGYSF